MKLDDHTVISNIHQRSSNEKGGRPALIVNNKKYTVENLTNTLISIPWGVEVTWGLLTPKNISKDSTVKKIVVGAIYVKPNSRKKSATHDHLAEVYNTLNAKYGRGTYWIIAGDTNTLKLGPILALNHNLKNVVTKPTRINHKNPSKSSTLDNIITDLHMFYQEPEHLPPIDPDQATGKPSDHLTIVFKPINVINNSPLRKSKAIIRRPMTDSGIKFFSLWINEQDWHENKKTHDVNNKVQVLNKMLLETFHKNFPVKTSKVSTDDSPWCNDKVKHLKRLKCREFNKHRSSEKWDRLNKIYKTAVITAKNKYYKDIVKDIKQSNPSKWYSKLKRICSFDQEKYQPIVCAEIENISDQEQAEKIAEFFAAPRQAYDALLSCDIKVTEINEKDFPQFSHLEVATKLTEIKTRTAVPDGDIPPKIIKEFAKEIAVPLSDIINSSIKQGVWPTIWKTELVSPIAKVVPTKYLKNLRSISGLVTFNQIQEKFIAKLIISDMKSKMDPSQYGNQRGISIQHYPTI